MPMSKWVPTTDLKELRRLGKLGEELGEASAVASRCIIQGLDELDPSSKRINRNRLEDEIADVLAQCNVTINMLNLDSDRIKERQYDKEKQMWVWEELSND